MVSSEKCKRGLGFKGFRDARRLDDWKKVWKVFLKNSMACFLGAPKPHTKNQKHKSLNPDLEGQGS